MMIINAFLIVMIMITMIYAFKTDKSFINPPLLQPIPWIFSITVYVMNIEILGNISSSTIFIILAGILMFQLGYYTIFLINKKNIKKDYEIKKQYISLKYIDVLIIVDLIFMMLIILKAIEIAKSINVINFFVSLRLGLGQFSDTTGGYGVLSYALTIANGVFAFIFILYKSGFEELKKRVKISFFIALVISVLHTGRGFLTQLFLIWMSITLIKQKDRKNEFRLISKFLVLFLITFVLYAIFLKKGIDTDGGIENIFKGFREQMILYGAASIKAFDHWLSNLDFLDFGLNIFRTPIVILTKLGFDLEVIDLVKEFSNTKIPTNVYTIYQPYIADFGVLFAFVIQCILGYLYSYMYIKCKEGEYICIFMFSVLMYAFVTQFFIDSYFSLMSTWIQYLVMSIILFKSNIFIKSNGGN
ncbi:Uncharacterised protein [[Clostridium] sordellii]|uniref:O-antigen polymerase n=1 Tax=Paraclostridium sordellii TaxID=1505 RepID=UPI0005E97ACC|nr:O-antigen polymerase [Paeniclostridium sordellii]CEN23756.1 Uncharacterised protein [[Clostridium] sordellii] [Paeniclostridium sordellii]